MCFGFLNPSSVGTRSFPGNRAGLAGVGRFMVVPSRLEWPSVAAVPYLGQVSDRMQATAQFFAAC